MNFLKLIKNIYFVKKEYIKFFNELKIAIENKNCIVLFNKVKNIPTIVVIINFNIFIFYKKNNNFIFEQQILPEDSKKLDFYLIDFIKSLKGNSNSVSNSSLIEFFVEKIHSHKHFLKFNEDDIFFVLKVLFSFDKSFFYNGNYLFIEEKTYNKWLD